MGVRTAATDVKEQNIYNRFKFCYTAACYRVSNIINNIQSGTDALLPERVTKV